MPIFNCQSKLRFEACLPPLEKRYSIVFLGRVPHAHIQLSIVLFQSTLIVFQSQAKRGISMPPYLFTHYVRPFLLLPLLPLLALCRSRTSFAILNIHAPLPYAHSLSILWQFLYCFCRQPNVSKLQILFL